MRIDHSELIVWHSGKKALILNAHLVARQMLSLESVKMIRSLHSYKLTLLDRMRRLRKPERLREVAKLIEDTEFMLQEAWKFPRDINWHRFWLLPKCTCPKMDNEDRYPSGHYVIDCACPIHGETNE